MNNKIMIKSIVKYSIIAVIAALTTAGIYERFKISKAIDSIKYEFDAADRRLDDEINAKIKSYNSEQARIVEEYKQRIDRCINISFENARDGAAKFSGEMGNLTYLLKLSYLFACDKAFNDDSSEKEIGEKVSNYISRHINDGLDKVDILIKDCYKELSKNHTKLRLEVDSVLENRPLSKELKLRLKSLDYALSSIQSTSMFNSVRLAITLALEGILIKDTCRITLRLLSPVVAKMGTAVGSSLADGPLPIGDILGAGLTLWSVYDIYCIKVETPENIMSILNSELDRQEVELIEEIDTNILDLLEKFEQ